MAALGAARGLGILDHVAGRRDGGDDNDVLGAEGRVSLLSIGHREAGAAVGAGLRQAEVELVLAEPTDVVDDALTAEAAHQVEAGAAVEAGLALAVVDVGLTVLVREVERAAAAEAGDEVDAAAAGEWQVLPRSLSSSQVAPQAQGESLQKYELTSQWRPFQPTGKTHRYLRLMVRSGPLAERDTSTLAFPELGRQVPWFRQG